MTLDSLTGIISATRHAITTVPDIRIWLWLSGQSVRLQLLFNYLAIEMAKKDWKAPSKTNGSSSWRESVVGLETGQAGPIAQWRSGGGGESCGGSSQAGQVKRI
jgi:hypothetical protein